MADRLAAALHAALETEHEVIYGYGVAGAHLHGGRTAVLNRLAEHQALRDALTELLRRAGLAAAAPRSAYALPFPVATADDAAQLGVLLETSAAGAAWDVIAASGASTPARRLGVGALDLAADWTSRWTGSAPLPEPLPGQPAASQPSTTPTSSPSSSITPAGTTS